MSYAVARKRRRARRYERRMEMELMWASPLVPFMIGPENTNQTETRKLKIATKLSTGSWNIQNF